MAAINYQGLYEGLISLQPPDASVPKTRMESAWQVRDMIVRAVQKDQTSRDWKRSRLKGLVDGNPPYQQSALIAAGRADECNVNWRIAKYFLTLAMGMLYDVFSQAETYATVTLDGYKLAETLGKIENGNFPTDSDATEWSRIITEEFDRLQRDDANFDTVNQLSQANSVLYGTGPMGFDDDLDWRMWQYESRHLLVPEMAKSNLEFWEWAALIVEYTPNKLYERIANPEIALSRGWNVAASRKAIMNAHPITRTGPMFQNWSWHQDMLKNGTFYYADQNKIVRCAHFYFKEFPEGQDEDGGITEVIIDLDTMAAVTENGQIDFLFRAPRRYKEWRDVIHPFRCGGNWSVRLDPRAPIKGLPHEAYSSEANGASLSVTTALDDAKTGHGIRLDTAKAGHEMRVDAMKAGHEMSMNRLKTQAQAKNGKPAAK